MKTNYDYIIYADGVYSIEHKEGAFSFLILNGDEEEIMRRSFKTKNETINRAELKGIIGGLYQITTWNKKILIVSDSQYALFTLSKEWERKSNEDLFEVYDRLVEDRKMIVSFDWVKEHSGDTFHAICDELCKKSLGYDASREYLKYKKKKIIK